MNRKETVAFIIKALGGQENIENYTHCVTRLRFNLMDEKKADIKQLEDVDGILGTTIQGGQYQIIIGTAVKDYFEEVSVQLAGITAGKENTKEKQPFSVMRILDVLTSIIAPVIPAFCASGMLKCIVYYLPQQVFYKGMKASI